MRWRRKRQQIGPRSGGPAKSGRRAGRQPAQLGQLRRTCFEIGGAIDLGELAANFERSQCDHWQPPPRGQWRPLASSRGSGWLVKHENGLRVEAGSCGPPLGLSARLLVAASSWALRGLLANFAPT